MEQTIRTFKSLSDPTRLRILVLLLRRELCVCELTAALEMEQSRISHQLRVLRNAELVEDRREGKWIIYRISKDKEKDLKFIFKHLFDDEILDSEEFATDYKKLEASQKLNLRDCPVSIERRNV